MPQVQPFICTLHVVGFFFQFPEPDAYFSAEDGQEEYDSGLNEEETEEEYMGMSM